jgi:hypothetical protein
MQIQAVSIEDYISKIPEDRQEGFKKLLIQSVTIYRKVLKKVPATGW